MRVPKCTCAETLRQLLKNIYNYYWWMSANLCHPERNRNSKLECLEIESQAIKLNLKTAHLATTNVLFEFFATSTIYWQTYMNLQGQVNFLREEMEGMHFWDILKNVFKQLGSHFCSMVNREKGESKGYDALVSSWPKLLE